MASKNVIDVAREILDNKQYQVMDDTLIDLQTANAIVTIYDALNDDNKARLAAMEPYRAAAVCWSVLSEA